MNTLIGWMSVGKGGLSEALPPAVIVYSFVVDSTICRAARSIKPEWVAWGCLIYDKTLKTIGVYSKWPNVF